MRNLDARHIVQTIKFCHFTKEKGMILEGFVLRSYISNGSSPLGDGGGDSINDLDYAACVMYSLLFLVLYLVLVFVAVYTAMSCNKNNPMWLLLNMFIAVFFPSLYLIIHPNLVLSHEGPLPYCATL